MSDKDPATAAAEAAAKELVKLAYGDLIQPAAREIGTEMGEFVRAIVVAGRGFGYLIREKYEPFVLRALNKVPVEMRIAPPPPLLGKILEGVSYEAEGSHVEKMSASLLATAMDKNKATDAHPAFIDVIHRMSAIELDVLRELGRNQIYVGARPSGGSFTNVRWHVNKNDKIELFHNADLVFDNLNSSGLISFIKQARNVRPFRDLEHVAEAVLRLQNDPRDYGDYTVMLSPFGRAFLLACSPEV
ncbi:Abi-alpha family protein [Methylobacterium sp. CM6244]